MYIKIAGRDASQSL